MAGGDYMFRKRPERPVSVRFSDEGSKGRAPLT